MELPLIIIVVFFYATPFSSQWDLEEFENSFEHDEIMDI